MININDDSEVKAKVVAWCGKQTSKKSTEDCVAALKDECPKILRVRTRSLGRFLPTQFNAQGLGGKRKVSPTDLVTAARHGGRLKSNDDDEDFDEEPQSPPHPRKSLCAGLCNLFSCRTLTMFHRKYGLSRMSSICQGETLVQ